MPDIDIAKETSVLNIDDKIGTTTDTGATSSNGTVMGKLNELIETNVKELIGETADTNGTSSAGSLMGKTNTIINNTVNLTTKMIEANTGITGLKSNLQTVDNNIDSILSKINSLGSIKGTIYSNINRAVSIQSFTVTITYEKSITGSNPIIILINYEDSAYQSSPTYYIKSVISCSLNKSYTIWGGNDDYSSTIEFSRTSATITRGGGSTRQTIYMSVIIIDA